MFELLTLIAIVLAISALSSARGLRSRLETEIAALKLEVRRLSEGQPLAATPTEMTAAPELAADQTPAEQAAAPESAAAEPVEAPMSAMETAGEITPAEAVPAASLEEWVAAPAAPRESFESMLAARWSVWVGGLALAFAGLFAVKYSIDQGLLSPAVRLSLAALFGLAMMAAGEWVRRRSEPLLANRFNNALIPGILTAAGSLTLMGSVYVAHGFYGFIGPAMAFTLLAAISLATLALSLLHGQALAGLGLVASFVTPVLVSSESPKPWVLFGFLIVVWIASTLASRIRDWRVAPAVANAGLCLWALLYLGVNEDFEVAPIVLSLLVMLAGMAFVWPGRDAESPMSADLPPEEAEPLAQAEGSEATPAAPVVAPAPAAPSAWERLLMPSHVAAMLVAALGTFASAVAMVAPENVSTGHAEWGFFILTVALAIFGAFRLRAVFPALFGALAAFGGIRVMSFGAASTSLSGAEPGGFQAFTDPALVIMLALLLGAVFAALGLAVIWKRHDREPQFSLLWLVLGTFSPLVLSAISFVYFGNYTLDWTHGLYVLVLGLLWVGTAVLLDPSLRSDTPAIHIRDGLLAASWIAFVAAIMVLTNGMASTLLVAFLGFAYVLAMRARPWPALPWAMVASAIFVAGRIAWDPTIVGPEHLSTTPVFNQLLAGYGIPSILLIASAWMVRDAGDRIRNVIEALASLFTLLTIAILVRHAMNDGVLNDALPTLGEQAIYTLLTIGASATLMALDFRRPSIVFRTGSMAIGYISMASVLFAHYLTLNPYFSGELTGSIPFFNLLFLGYLLPAVAYGATAQLARSRRPYHYVVALALTGASLAFAYVTLSVRRLFHGASIADWKGFLQSELYAYSIVWLLLGVLLLVAGYRFKAKSIRIASAVLVLVAVAKVFLIDMSSLEGFYRVLSFAGLGIVLIGIGGFYQKVLLKLERQEREAVEPPPPLTVESNAN